MEVLPAIVTALTLLAVVGQVVGPILTDGSTTGGTAQTTPRTEEEEAVIGNLGYDNLNHRVPNEEAREAVIGNLGYDNLNHRVPNEEARTGTHGYPKAGNPSGLVDPYYHVLEAPRVARRVQVDCPSEEKKEAVAYGRFLEKHQPLNGSIEFSGDENGFVKIKSFLTFQQLQNLDPPSRFLIQIKDGCKSEGELARFPGIAFADLFGSVGEQHSTNQKVKGLIGKFVLVTGMYGSKPGRNSNRVPVGCTIIEAIKSKTIKSETMKGKIVRALSFKKKN